MGKQITRKKFIAASLLTAISLPQTLMAISENRTPFNPMDRGAAAIKDRKICIFSKCLQWLNYQDMADLAAAAGFDGIDLTVRKNGHVLPENVANDLPKAVEAIEKAGLKVYMLTTDIAGADGQYTAGILKTAASLGIKYYRTDWFPYDQTIDIPANIEQIKRKLSGLSVLNKQ